MMFSDVLLEKLCFGGGREEQPLPKGWRPPPDISFTPAKRRWSQTLLAVAPEKAQEATAGACNKGNSCRALGKASPLSILGGAQQTPGRGPGQPELARGPECILPAPGALAV